VATDHRPSLTPEENDLLGALRTYLEGHDFPPTYRQLALWCNRPLTGTYRTICTLRDKGYVTGSLARTLRIIPPEK